MKHLSLGLSLLIFGLCEGEVICGEIVNYRPSLLEIKEEEGIYTLICQPDEFINFGLLTDRDGTSGNKILCWNKGAWLPVGLAVCSNGTVPSFEEKNEGKTLVFQCSNW